jgi:hypothetical protein
VLPRHWNRNDPVRVRLSVEDTPEEDVMNGLIYLVGLIVVIMAVLSLFGLR